MKKTEQEIRTAGDILRHLIGENKLRVSITYLLLFLECGATVMQPFFLGLLVDRLIRNDLTGILYICGLYLFQLLVGAARRAYDTRLYSGIYYYLSTRIVAGHFRAAESVSKTAAHTNLSREFTDFLERDMASVVRGLMNVTGAILMIGTYSPVVMGLCLFSLAPLFYISKQYQKKLNLLYQVQHSEWEKQVEVLGTRNMSLVNRFFKKLQRNQVQISDRNAVNFAFIEWLALMVFGISIYYYATHNLPVQAGAIVALASYMGVFFIELVIFQTVVERMARLKDIAGRIADIWLVKEEQPPVPARPVV